MGINPREIVDQKRRRTQDLPLTFPKDGSINNNQTMISLRSYNRRNPSLIPTFDAPSRHIYLPLPFSGIEDNIAMKYTEVPLGAVGGIMDVGKNPLGTIAGGAMAAGQFAATTALGAIGDIEEENINSFGQQNSGSKVKRPPTWRERFTQAAAKRVTGAAKQMAGQGKEALAQSIGIANNPNLSLSFEGVELRTHTFTWRLIPKSLEESIEIENIINTLKLNALPERIFGAGFHLSYPAVAFIDFFPSNLIKISDKGCFITSVNVKYDGDGHPSFFNREKPVIVDLSVSFKERAILTADDYKQTKSIGT